jgi:TonB family protein
MSKFSIFRMAVLSFAMSLSFLLVKAQDLPLPPDGGSPPVAASERLMHIGGSVLPPKVLHSKEPTFSKEARKAKISGIVQVYLWVEKDGSVSHIRVVKSVGYGLDEKAVEAVRKYKFKPATKDGEPVIVDLYIDVNFQIFDKPPS